MVAAKWLALQGLLAIIRVAIWIWNPEFDDFEIERGEPGITGNYVNLSELQLVMLWYTYVYPTKLPATRSTYRHTKTEMGVYEKLRRRHARPAHWSGWNVPSKLRIPTWVLPYLDYTRINVYTGFDLARRLRAGGPDWQQDLNILMGATHFWDMPAWLFMLWVDAHTSQQLPRPSTDDAYRWEAYGCRIVHDLQGQCHMLPYWTTKEVYVFVPGYMDEPNKRYISNAELPIQVFGDPVSDERCIYAFTDIDVWDSEDTSALPRKQELLIGWEAATSKGFESKGFAPGGTSRNVIIEQVESMWRDLDAVLLRARKREP
ncbi:MAG: hypothetical protein Q9222_005796 [Ikaeria aurantiellina]